MAQMIESEVYAGIPSKVEGEKDKGCTIKMKIFGATLKDDIEHVGEKVVKSNYEKESKVQLQAAIRRLIKAGKSEADIQKELKDWKPGVVVRAGGDPVQNLKKSFTNMSKEEKAAILKELQAAV